MQTDTDYRNVTILMIVLGLMLSIRHHVLSPLLIPFVVTYFAFYNFKVRKEHNGSFYNGIMVLSLILMFILEYFLVPVQNIIFYILLVILSLGWFLVFYFSFSYTLLNQKGKFLTWTGVILFALSFSMLLGVADNDFFVVTLVMGVSVLIIFLVAFFIRKRRFGKYF